MLEFDPMQPPALDAIGKNQRKSAVRPNQRIAHTEEGAAYLETVLGSVSQVDARTDGEANTKALAATGKPSRRRLLLTQQILAGLAAGESVIDIADRLGVVTATITAHVARHRRTVEAAEIDERLDQIAVPLATDNLIHGLIAGDKDYTIKTLEGRGKLRRHTEDTGGGARDLPVLRISIEVPGSPGIAASPQSQSALPSASQFVSGGRIVGVMRLPKPVVGTVVSNTPNEGDTSGVQIAGAPRTAPEVD